MGSPEKAGGPAADRTSRTATTTNQATSSITRDSDRLSSYRSAAQAIRRQDTSLGERGARLIELMQHARAECDAWIRVFAQQIIWAQAEWMLEGNEALRQSRARGRLELASRRLRFEGYECCPKCEQRLSDPSDWSFWSALRRAEVDRLIALEAGEAA